MKYIHKKHAGFFKVYAFGIIAIVTIAYAAYYFGKLATSTPSNLQQEYTQYYNQNEDAYYKYSSDPGYDDVSHGDTSPFPNTSAYPNGTANYPARSATLNTTSVPPSNERPPQQISGETTAVPQNQSASVTTAGSPSLQGSNIPPASSNPSPTNAITSTPVNLTDTFISTTNKRVSFLIPKGSVVRESGSIDKQMVFVVTTPEDKKFTINLSKDTIGCEDPVHSFAIDATEGVDYRIVHEQKETALKSTYRAMRAYEEYGTYGGQIGVRMNACVFSAVQTRIEIRGAGYSRADVYSGFNLMGEILNSFKF